MNIPTTTKEYLISTIDHCEERNASQFNEIHSLIQSIKVRQNRLADLKLELRIMEEGKAFEDVNQALASIGPYFFKPTERLKNDVKDIVKETLAETSTNSGDNLKPSKP